jgi:serine/threonine protein kinase
MFVSSERQVKKIDTPPIIGQKISHYHILRELGEGGMGKVYLAQDTKLKRQVALKILPPEVAKDPERILRLRQEAKDASQLNHPNIITIYEVGCSKGIPFIASEYIDGETLYEKLLREPLALSQVLRITLQIAKALVASHEIGLIHRDIKPQNIMLRHKDGWVKVIDWGLAKSSGNEKWKIDLTRTTKKMFGYDDEWGTLAYLSPEQLQKKKIDARSDIWNLGIMLYEMLTRSHPFLRKSPFETIAAIQKDEFTPLDEDKPKELTHILRRSLHKDPEKRYQAVKDFQLDIEELKDDLKIAGVLDTSTTPPFKPARIGRKNYPYKNIFITVVLILTTAGFGYGFWYSQSLKKQARNHVVAGYKFLKERKKESLLMAKAEFEKAAEKDPNYALAFVGLADFYVLSEEYIGTPSSETLPMAEDYIKQALTINDSLGEAYATLGFIRAKQWKWVEAESLYKKAINLNREYSTARQWYCLHLRVTGNGNFEDSLRQIEVAFRLDSSSPMIYTNLVIAYLLQNDLDNSIKHGKELVALYPDSWQGHSWLGLAYLKQGNKAKAIEQLKKAVENSGRSHTLLANLGYGYAYFKENGEAQKIIKELEELYDQKKAIGQDLAKVFAGLEDKERAFDWLDKDLKARSGDLPNISWHPAFDSLRGEPRYNMLLVGINLKPTP